MVEEGCGRLNAYLVSTPSGNLYKWSNGACENAKRDTSPKMIADYGAKMAEFLLKSNLVANFRVEDVSAGILI